MHQRSRALVALSLLWSAGACATSPPTSSDSGEGISKSESDAARSSSEDAGIREAGRREAGSRDAGDRDAIPHADTGSAVPDGASVMDADRGAPQLVALSLSATAQADSSPPMELVPRFSSTIHDYYVRCPSATNAITVSMTASTGASSLLLQPTPSPSLPAQTVALSVNENEAIVLAATDGDATTEYWIRCLPGDVPPLQWTPQAENGTPSPGYYLVGNQIPGGDASSGGSYALVLDGNGVPVWYARAPPGEGVANVDSLVPNALSFDLFASGTYATASFELQNLAPPRATTHLAPAGTEVDLHELRLLNGNYLIFSLSPKAGVDLTGLRAGLADGGIQTLGPGSTILDCSIVEFTSSGAVVSTWTFSDHFDPAKDSTFPQAVPGVGEEWIDTFHCNSIDIDPANGNLLVSARNMDSIFYVDWSSGAVLWKMGGSPYSYDGATYVSVDDPFFRQHDARLQPGWSQTRAGGSGQVSVFDDETKMAGPARAVTYDVVVGAGDGGADDESGCEDGSTGDCAAPGKATVAWQYKGPASSAGGGSFRVSDDGTSVIGWGALLLRTPGLAFTEVDVGGHVLLAFSFANDNSSYRAVKVPLAQFDLATLRHTAGLPP